MKKLITISSPQFKRRPISFYRFLTTSPKNAISLANNPHYLPKGSQDLASEILSYLAQEIKHYLSI